MKEIKCPHCGKEVGDDAFVCIHCGCAVNSKETKKGEPSTLKVVAKVLMIISTIINAFAIIPLLWCIPMTISLSKKMESGEKVTTGFKVCVLLFVNMISGILLLCDND